MLDLCYTDWYIPSMSNRRNIINQALSLFAARGYDAVGIQEIVDAAGVSKPTLYHYFKSKQGLLQALLSDHFADLHKQMKREAEYDGDLTLTLQKVVGCCFRYAAKHPHYYRLQLCLWFAPPDSEAHRAVNQHNVQQHELLQTLFAEATKDHGNMEGRQRTYAATFFGIINTYIGLHLNDFVELDQQTIQRVVHQFMHGILS